MTDNNFTRFTPVSKFYYEVIWNESKSTFNNVSGLDEVMKIKEPQYMTASDSFKPLETSLDRRIHLSQGVFSSKKEFQNWYDEVKEKPQDFLVKLLSESGELQMSWLLKNCVPINVSVTYSGPTDVNIKTMEVRHEGITTQ